MDVQIERMDCRYSLPRGGGDPTATQRRLDRIAVEQLARVWASRIAPEAGASADESYYFIEYLDIHLALDLSADDHALAAAWARALQQGLVHAVSRGEGVLIFRDRSDLLASLLADLLRGHAWERWVYRQFEPFKALPLGQAALRVLTEDGDTGRDTLLELARRGELELLLSALDQAESEAMVERCLLPPGPRLPQAARLAVWGQALHTLLPGPFQPGDTPARNLARLYLGLLIARPDLGPDVNLARWLADLLHLAQTLATRPDRRHLLAALAADESDAVLAPLDHGRPTPLLAELARALGGAATAALLGKLSSESVGQRLATPYGGLFLLLPTLLELELDAFLASCPYPEPVGVTKAGLLRFLLALQTLGRAHAPAARRDPALAYWAGLDTPPNAAQLAQYAEQLMPTQHAAFEAAWQAHLHRLNRRHFPPGEPAPAPIKEADWFRLAEGQDPVLPDSAWDRALARVSATVVRQFAARLGAFAASSPAYLCRNVWESRAVVELAPRRLEVRFLTCPLQVVLRMAGFEHPAGTVPWLEDRALTFAFE